MGPSGNGLVAADERGGKPAESRAFRLSAAPVRFQKAVSRSKEKRRSGAPRGAPVRVMGRQFPPAGGTGPIVRRANGSAFRPANFGAPLPSFWECEGFETDNLTRQSAGMRRAATLPHAATMQGKDDAGLHNQHRRDQVTRDCFAEPVIGPANGRTR